MKRLTVMVAVGTLVLAACGGSEATTETTTIPETTTTTTEEATTTTSEAVTSTVAETTTTIPEVTTTEQESNHPAVEEWWCGGIEEAKNLGWTPEVFARELAKAMESGATNVPAESTEQAIEQLERVRCEPDYAKAVGDELGS
jgi:hypothetical protein